MARSRTILHLPILLLLVSLPALAGEGRSPVWESPTVISTPGRYVLIRNLTGNFVDPVISITASNVDLDLNGMEITNTLATTSAITVAAGPGEVTIRNGSIVGGARGIEVISPGAPGEVTIEDMRISAMNTGIFLDGVRSFTIRRTSVRDMTGSCIRIQGGPADKGGVIAQNECRDSTGGLALFQVGAVRIQDNEFENIHSSSAAAIAVFTGTGLVIAGNTIHNTNRGMDLATTRHSRISGNIISACLNFGIQIDAGGSDNLIADNLIAGTTAGPGLQVFGDRNEIRGNLLNTSSGFGLFFNGGAENNHYRDNTARANCQGACSCAVGTPTDFCDANPLNMNTDGGGNALP